MERGNPEVKEEWLEEKKRFQRPFKRQKEFLLLTATKTEEEAEETDCGA